MKIPRLLLPVFLLVTTLTWAQTYKYMRIGQPADAHTVPTAGTAMMGGGKDLDEAFRWLCNKASGGDFLILRFHGDDAYNPYVNDLCKANSVATLIIPSHEAAQDPKVAEIIRQAEAVFIAGGDQAFYVNYWKGSPVQDAVNANVAAGKPIGGTSAGLAILGEFNYGALGDKPDDEDLTSARVLVSPFHPRVTLVRDFLKVPYLQNTLTDSHFARRDRMGRTLVFLARLMQDGWSSDPREIAIDEKSALLVEGDGSATVVGGGLGVYLIHPTAAPKVCKPDTPLTFQEIDIHHLPKGAHFNVDKWKGNDGNKYSISVNQGVASSTQPGGSLY